MNHRSWPGLDLPFGLAGFVCLVGAGELSELSQNSLPYFATFSSTDYPLEWEYPSFKYTRPFAQPLTILIEGSDGCSDYGNKFGEPVVCGFTRSFGQLVGDGKDAHRREYYKPILFSGGVGTLYDAFIKKAEPRKGAIQFFCMSAFSQSSLEKIGSALECA